MNMLPTPGSPVSDTARPSRRRARGTIALAFGLAAGLGLSACGMSAAPEAASTGAATSAGPLSGTISFQTWNLKANFGPYFTGVINDFQKQNPGVKITWLDQPADDYATKLQSDAGNGTLPDVVNVTPDLAFPLAKAGVLDNIAAAAPDAKGDYLANAWADYSFPGKEGTYAFPWYLNTGPMFFNKSLFTKAGLDVNAPPTTLAQMHDQAIKLAATAKGSYYFLGALPTIADFGTYGVKTLSDDGKSFVFNTDQAAAILDKYVDMYKAGAIQPEALTQTYVGTGEAFRAEKIAFTSGSAYDLEKFKKEVPTLYPKVGISPAITDTGHANMFSQGVAVNAQSKNKAAAVAFARFVTNDANQLAFAKQVNIFPSTTKALGNSYFTTDDGSDVGKLRVLAAKQLTSARNYTPVVWTEEMRVALLREITDAVTGKQTSKQALDKAAAEANKLLAAMS